jgi:hypothetical protein
VRLPKSQGDEDGFCGLYSVLNSFSYLFRKLDEDRQAELFKRIAGAISPWPDIIWNGTETEDIWRMLHIAAGFTGSVRLARPFSRNSLNFSEFFAALHTAVAPNNTCAIIGLDKPYEHWTVAKSVSGKQIVLQDSCKLHLIDAALCGLPRSGAKWIIDPKCTFLITKVLHK